MPSIVNNYLDTVFCPSLIASPLASKGNNNVGWKIFDRMTGEGYAIAYDDIRTFLVELGLWPSSILFKGVMNRFKQE